MTLSSMNAGMHVAMNHETYGLYIADPDGNRLSNDMAYADVMLMLNRPSRWTDAMWAFFSTQWEHEQ